MPLLRPTKQQSLDASKCTTLNKFITATGGSGPLVPCLLNLPLDFTRWYDYSELVFVLRSRGLLLKFPYVWSPDGELWSHFFTGIISIKKSVIIMSSLALFFGLSLSYLLKVFSMSQNEILVVIQSQDHVNWPCGGYLGKEYKSSYTVVRNTSWTTEVVF